MSRRAERLRIQHSCAALAAALLVVPIGIMGWLFFIVHPVITIVAALIVAALIILAVVQFLEALRLSDRMHRETYRKFSLQSWS
jgi:membrane protein YdbS with pleckstrin-like domain